MLLVYSCGTWLAVLCGEEEWVAADGDPPARVVSAVLQGRNHLDLVSQKAMVLSSKIFPLRRANGLSWRVPMTRSGYDEGHGALIFHLRVSGAQRARC